MSGPSAPRLLVLHGLRLRGFGAPADVAAIVGIELRQVEGQLRSLADDGLVAWRDGRLTGWALTPDGRAEQERLLAAELAASGGHEAIEGAYRRFLGLNGELLAACTAWQLRDGATNDHADPAYDATVVERLRALHRELSPVLVALEDGLDRYRGYRPRFERALARLDAGEPEWFAKPMIDSYHTVWFQLHEDLLNTLGRQRAEETGAFT